MVEQKQKGDLRQNNLWGEERDLSIIDLAINGYVLIGRSGYFIAIPNDSSLKLRKMLMAAFTADQMRIKSIDYTLKKYGSHWNLQGPSDDFTKLMTDLLRKIRNAYEEIVEKQTTLEGLPDLPGLVLAGAALMRLQSSFKAATFFIQQGLNIEAMCICKLILEQCSWAYVVHSIKDEKFIKVKANECITAFKKLFPLAGWLYGYLNQHAHINPIVTSYFFKIKEHVPTVILQNSYQGLVTSLYLMLLVDAYGICMEFIYRKYFSKFQYINLNSNDEVSLNPKRVSWKLVHQMHLKVKNFQKSHTSLPIMEI